MRGDSSRKVQHQQQRKPRKKTKPPALTKKHKKKRRRGPRRPQKPIPPAVPQGNLSMPTSVSLPVEASQIRSVTGPRSRGPMALRTPRFSYFRGAGARMQIHHLGRQSQLFSFQRNFDQISDGVVSEIKLLFKAKRADVEIEDLIVYSRLFYSIEIPYMSQQKYPIKNLMHY